VMDPTFEQWDVATRNAKAYYNESELSLTVLRLGSLYPCLVRVQTEHSTFNFMYMYTRLDTR